MNDCPSQFIQLRQTAWFDVFIYAIKWANSAMNRYLIGQGFEKAVWDY